MEPIVPKLKRLLREKGISHAVIADRLGKHRTFITRKLGSDSMETRLLEAILLATNISYQELFCQESSQTASFRDELDALREEVSFIKEQLPGYNVQDSASQP